MAKYKSTCARCDGTGRYDRGTCFGCNGAGHTLTTRKPAQRYTVSAIYSDGVRRVMRKKASATPGKAIASVLSERDWSEFFDLRTVTAA